jgi:heptaprenyl diphosphate synthase
LGLANLPLIIGLTFLRPGDLAVVLALKVLGQALVNGTLASYVFLFSLAGSTVSVLVMAATYHWGGRHVSLVGVSLAGAWASSLVQVILSITVVFGPSARLIAPLFVGTGTATGLIIGIFARAFSRKSTWLAGVKKRYADGNRGFDGT